MLSLPPSVRVYVAPNPVDARKGFDGLSLYVQAQLQLDPLSGHLFVFFNRRLDQVRILYWDRSGYVLYAKASGTRTIPHSYPVGRAGSARRN